MGLHIFFYLILLPALHETEYFAYRRRIGRFFSLFRCARCCGRNSQQTADVNAGGGALSLNQLDRCIREHEESHVNAEATSEQAIVDQTANRLGDQVPIIHYNLVGVCMFLICNISTRMSSIRVGKLYFALKNEIRLQQSGRTQQWFIVRGRSTRGTAAVPVWKAIRWCRWRSGT